MNRNPAIWALAFLVSVIAGEVLMLPSQLMPRVQMVAADLHVVLWNARTATYNIAAASGNLKTISAALVDPHTGIERTLRNANTVTAQIGRTSNVARLASSEQREALQKMSAETLATLSAANALIGKTNERLNGDAGAIQTFTGDLTKLGVVIDASGGLIKSSTATMDSAGRLLSDPHWQPMIARFGDSADKIASASGHIDVGLLHLQNTTSYIEDMFKPKKVAFWRSLAGAIASHALGPAVGALIERAIPAKVDVVNTVQTQAK